MGPSEGSAPPLLERPLVVIAIVGVAGVAAGAAAAVTATLFPYALGLTLKAMRSKSSTAASSSSRREGKEPYSSSSSSRHKSSSSSGWREGRELKDIREGREAKEGKEAKLESKSKRAASPAPSAQRQQQQQPNPQQQQQQAVLEAAFREAVGRGLIEWKDIDVSFDEFPYFLSDVTKTALVNSTFVRLRRPEFVKFMADPAHAGARILLCGPPGSETYQEQLVRALAKHLKVKLLVFDSSSATSQPLLLQSSAQHTESVNSLPVTSTAKVTADGSSSSSSSVEAGKDAVGPSRSSTSSIQENDAAVIDSASTVEASAPSLPGPASSSLVDLLTSLIETGSSRGSAPASATAGNGSERCSGAESFKVAEADSSPAAAGEPAGMSKAADDWSMPDSIATLAEEVARAEVARSEVAMSLTEGAESPLPFAEALRGGVEVGEGETRPEGRPGPALDSASAASASSGPAVAAAVAAAAAASPLPGKSSAKSSTVKGSISNCSSSRPSSSGGKGSSGKSSVGGSSKSKSEIEPADLTPSRPPSGGAGSTSSKSSRSKSSAVAGGGSTTTAGGSSSRSKEKEKDKDKDLLAAAASVAAGVDGSSAAGDSKRAFKKGDKVKFMGSTASSSSAHPSSSAMSSLAWSLAPPTPGPPVGSKGRVVLVLEENPNKVGVRFDKPFVGGNGLVDLCEEGHGFFCSVSDLRLETSSTMEDSDKLQIEAFLEVAACEAAKEPLLVFMKNVEKAVVGHFDKYLKLDWLEKLDAVVIGGHVVPDPQLQGQQQKKDKSGASKNSNQAFSALLDLSFLDQLSMRLEGAKPDGTKATARILNKVFPTRVSIQPPQEEKAAAEWTKRLEADADSVRAESNRQKLQAAMAATSVECSPESLRDVNVTSVALSQDASEKIVGWAVSRHLQETREPQLRNEKLTIDGKSLQHSVALYHASQQPTSHRKSLKDVVCENEFETMLLSEVIPPDELGVTFERIGALDTVKETLRELVMLPLQRPELFRKGQLTRPVRGLLLFGPPGTGKTMLAKAVATESGANFINVSMASIASKWFGEAEKYVKAVFTLASKIAPCVIFVDEVDSMLGRRGKDTEHTAMRKVKNEFMASWDGLRTRDQERVLVLGATNRPFDLDDAVIRRFPRRLMVDLPNADNRAKILRVILADEDLSSDLDIDELARTTDGYSGSDLRNLCVTAAFQRIRDFLDNEKKEKTRRGKERTDKDEGPSADIGKESFMAASEASPDIRPISMEDMQMAMEKVKSSVCMDAATMQELVQWNEQYGEGGTGKTLPLTYFM